MQVFRCMTTTDGLSETEIREVEVFIDLLEGYIIEQPLNEFTVEFYSLDRCNTFIEKMNIEQRRAMFLFSYRKNG